jgi:long-chain acyl-CoA synthetase
MLHGGLNYLIANPRNIPQFLRELKRVPFTALTGVNMLFGALVQQPEFRALDFSRLRFVGGGGSAIQRPIAERWREVTGTTIVEGFGLTEASPLVCMNPPRLADFNGCIGVPVPSTECRVVDDECRAVPPGEAGELWARGPQVMQGYWRRPEETAQVLTPDGWLKTGDIAVMRLDGFFRIVERKKDMILVSGFNVYPNEIEEVAAMHAGVTESAAIGVPNARTGGAVRLVVVRSDPALTEAELLRHCRENLTNYMIPRQVLFVEDLPKSNVGKILRREVRARCGEAVAP